MQKCRLFNKLMRQLIRSQAVINNKPIFFSFFLRNLRSCVRFHARYLYSLYNNHSRKFHKDNTLIPCPKQMYLIKSADISCP